MSDEEIISVWPCNHRDSPMVTLPPPLAELAHRLTSATPSTTPTVTSTTSRRDQVTYLVGTDIGTLGTKTVVVDPEGHIKGTSFIEYSVMTPKAGMGRAVAQSLGDGSPSLHKDCYREGEDRSS